MLYIGSFYTYVRPLNKWLIIWKLKNEGNLTKRNDK